MNDGGDGVHFLLFYEKGADYASREPRFQAEHRAHVFAAVERGELVLGGPLEGPIDGSNLLLFEGDSPAVAESFAAADPYVIQGIVVKWHVRPWRTVVGKAATDPLR